MDSGNLSWDAEVVLKTLEVTGESRNCEGAKKATRLQELTGLDKRALRIAIRELRLRGYKVCSHNPGYWLWDGKDDSWRHTKSHIKSRLRSMLELWQAMENAPVEGQEQMELVI